MVSPGEVYAQMADSARKVLTELSQEELIEYKRVIELIANKYNRIDERLSGFNAKGKLSMIEQILREE